MRLNLDCIRDILLIIEEEQTMQKIDQSILGESGVMETGMVKPMYDNQFLSHVKLQDYPSDDIFYSIKQLGESGLLDVDDSVLQGGRQFYEILDITPYGHEFISNLKSNTVWEKVKSIIKSVNGASLSVITKVAAETLLKQILS